MTPRRLVVALLVLLVAAANVAWITLEQYGESAIWDAKVRRAERIIYYHAAPDTGPVFELTGEEVTMKVITHASFTATDYDPRRVTRYSIQLELTSPGGEVQWSDEVHIRSRQSKRGRDGDLWIDENTFVRAQHVQVTDDRLTRIDLPADVERGSLLSVRARGLVDDVLVRAYLLKERSPTDARIRELALPAQRRQSAARRAGLGNWGHYSPAERRTINTAWWERMSARGERGIDYEHRYVYYTGFRLPLEAAESERWMPLEPGLPLVLNLQGPSAVRVQARSVGAARSFRMEAVSTENTPRERSFTTSEGPVDEVFFVRRGVHSLRWFTDAPVELKVEALAGGGAQFGKYARERYLTGVLTPDWRRVPAAITGPGNSPVHLPVAETRDPAMRRLRVSVRELPEPGRSAEGEPLQITVRTRHSDGTELASETRTIQDGLATFDRFETELGAQPIGERATIELLPGDGAATVEITADRRVAVNGYHFVPDEEAERLDRPYRDVAALGAGWRAAPHEREDWFLVRPEEWDARVEQGETGRLVLQVRLDPIGGDEDDGEGTAPKVARALRPIGSPRQRLILDQVPPERRRAVFDAWPAGTRTRLASKRPVDIRLGSGSGRASIEYWAPASALGEVARIRVGDELREETFTATRGRWRLDGETTARVELDLPPKVRTMINRPPRALGGNSLVRMRTVYLLGSRAVRLRVRVTDGQPAAINAVIYHPSDTDPVGVNLIALIDGGEPDRHGRAFSRFTPGERTRELGQARNPRAMAFANVKNRSAGRARLVTIPLGDDLSDGFHRVDLTVEGGYAWGRFFVLGSDGAGGFGIGRPRDLVPTKARDTVSVGRRDFVVGATALAACSRLDGTTPPDSDTAAIAQVVRPRDRVDFARTSIVERDALGAVIRDVFERGAVDATTVDLVTRARLRVERWSLSSGVVFAVREPADQRRGAGTYLFRTPSPDRRACILQTPHAFHDTDTAAIAAAMFFGPRGRDFAALFVNTVHRYRPTARGDEVREQSPCDLAHVNDHLFNHGTLVAARTLREVDFVQLHGFANRPVRRRDDSRKPGKPRAVIASGQPESTPFSRSVGEHLRGSFGVGVWLYPEKAGELGALDNAQGRTLSVVAGARFVHIEMALRMRADLRAHPASLRQLEAAVLADRETT